MRILVTGGTGTVGTKVVANLTAQGVNVRVLTRSPEKAAALSQRAEGAIGSLAEPGTLPPAFDGVDRLFLLTPLARDEVDQGSAAIEAATAARIERIVFMSVHHAAAAPEVPHFASKVTIARALERSGISYTVIEPNSFFQNDLRVRQPLLEFGIFPQPLGSVGLNRVDVRDIADAVVVALLEDGHTGEHYPVVGPTVGTGESIAESWSRALDRSVVYGGDDLDAWTLAASAMLPDWLVADLRVMYEHFQAHGLLATDDDFVRQRRLLGKDPRPFQRFAAEVAAAWKTDPTDG